MNTTITASNYPNWITIHNVLPNSKPDYFDLERVVKSISAEDLSVNSLLALKQDLKNFFSWFQVRYDEPFSFARCRKTDLIDYRNSLISIKRKPATINRLLASVKKFFKTAYEHQIVAEDITKGVKGVSSVQHAPKSLTDAEVHKLFREIELRQNAGHLLAYCLMVYAGLRVSEVCALKFEDIIISERKMHAIVHHGKGGRTRKVPLNTKIRAVFDCFVGSQAVPPASEFLFPGRNGHLATISINKMLEKYSNLADVKCSPHSLRHTFAYRFIKKHPGDILGLAQILGHSSIQTTQIYAQYRFEDLEKKVQAMEYEAVDMSELFSL